MSEQIRLNKYISDSGLCSRRQADRLIESGDITVDGVAAVLGMTVDSAQSVKYKGKLIKPVSKTVIYAYNKPIGQVCTSAEADKDSIFNYVEFPARVNYVGRLDKDSSGLLLLTNDGELANHIQKARYNHEKEYHVRVDRDVTDEFIRRMSSGVPVLDTVTKKCRVKKTGARTFSIVLTQGLNRQIRRMCDYLGYRVVYLKRVRVLNIWLDGIRPGTYRSLTDKETEALYKLVREEKNDVVGFQNKEN